MIAARKGEIVDYVLEDERELSESERTVFELDAGLSRKDCAVIQDSLVGYDPISGVITHRPGNGCLTSCTLGIRGIRNFVDDLLEVADELLPMDPAKLGSLAKRWRTILRETIEKT